MTVAGLTLIEVRDWLTTTVVLLVAINPAGSETVTWNEYEPAFEKVAVTLAAAFVALAL